MTKRLLPESRFVTFTTLLFLGCVMTGHRGIESRMQTRQDTEQSNVSHTVEPAITYHVSWPKPLTHFFHVRMEISRLNEEWVDVRIPAWRPGRYILQNYAKNIIGFQASDGKGKPLDVQKLDKGTWRIRTGGSDRIEIKYQSYAHQFDAGSSYLDESEAFLNPITMLTYIPGRELESVLLKLDRPDNWRVATALRYSPEYEGYLSGSYHDLADSPVLVSPDFELLTFEESGAQFEIVIQGEGNYDPERVVEGVRKIVAAQVDMMQTVPFDRYVFLYHFLPNSFRHGVEHKNSTSIFLGPANLEDNGAFVGFLSLTAHEFFHAWVVERIRPEAIYHPDYSREAYTSTMWIYEGITSYYGGLTLRHAGFIDESQFYQRLAGTIQGFDQTYGRKITSVAMTSWDSWTKTDGAPPHTFYSFYTAGSVLGLLLDLEVRARTENQKSLDHVFRYLYETYAQNDRGVPEDGFERALEVVTGTSFQPFFDAYVYGTEEIDYNRFLQHAGLVLVKEPDPSRPEVKLGATLQANDGMLTIRNVEPDSPAFSAGLDIDDILVALDGKRFTEDNQNTLLQLYKPGDTATVTFFRENDLRTVPITFVGDGNLSYRIVPLKNTTELQETIRKDWLR